MIEKTPSVTEIYCSIEFGDEMLEPNWEHRALSIDVKHAATVPDSRKPRRPKSAFGQLKALLRRRRLRRPATITEDHILSILIARRGREAVLGSYLFSEPAWDVLLELYAAELGTRTMSVADLARAIDTPESTTARWVDELAGRGLVVQHREPGQSGGPLVSLSYEGASKMGSLIDHWGAAFLSI
nr:winged helix-turn-helix transcriptional regulator [Sphingomonas sp.]